MKKIVMLCCLILMLTKCVNKENIDTEDINTNKSLIQLLDTPQITIPPAYLELDSFYEKYMNVNGIHVISSWRVPDSCFYAAYITVKALTDILPAEVMESLTRHNTRIGIMARYEGTTDIPEHAHLANDTTLNWDVRARGLGGTVRLPLTTCAEENILAYQIDKYHAEDILIHEFAHTIHYVGIAPIDDNFNSRLQASLDEAISNGKWVNTYAATNIAEYWAEGVQSWFNVNAEVDNDGGDGKHNKVNTRQELRLYDPWLYEIISEYFPETNEPISRHSTTNLYQYGM
jgi:alpha-glucosidase